MNFVFSKPNQTKLKGMTMAHSIRRTLLKDQLAPELPAVSERLAQEAPPFRGKDWIAVRALSREISGLLDQIDDGGWSIQIFAKSKRERPVTFISDYLNEGV